MREISAGVSHHDRYSRRWGGAGDRRQTAEPEQTLLKPEQLDALVAPIALYPDELLANVLAASTYPLEAVKADRWVKDNRI